MELQTHNPPAAQAAFERAVRSAGKRARGREISPPKPPRGGEAIAPRGRHNGQRHAGEETPMELQTHNPPAAQAATDIRTAEGFAAAAESLTRLLYAVSYAILQNSDACADAVQAALLKAWETRDRVQSAAGFPGYLVRIVQNESRDLLRRRRRHGTLPLDPDVAAVPGASGAAEPDARWLCLDVRRALATLPEQDRLIAALYYFERYTTGEVAALLRLPRGTVHSRLFRIRDKLRKELRGYELEH